MLEKTNQKTKKLNGQLIYDIGTLPLSGKSCPACPEQAMARRRTCPKIFSQRGQQILEYAVVMLAVVAAFSVMRIYAERGLQAHIKSQADQIGRQNESFELSVDDGYDRTIVTKDVDMLHDTTLRKNSTGLESSYNSLGSSVSKGRVNAEKTELVSIGYN